jgi:transglutaminase-like putative cysteine protease
VGAACLPAVERTEHPTDHPFDDASYDMNQTMRNHSHELHGSRVCFRYAVDLDYDVAGPSEFLLNVHAATTPHQWVLAESFETTPMLLVTVEAEPVTGNRIAAFHGEQGRISCRYSARVLVEHFIAEPDTLSSSAPTQLPMATMQYLYPSRYCQADLVTQLAWKEFSTMPRGYANVAAIRNWVQNNIHFQPGTSVPTTTALDTLRDGAGVCRDFAHVMISFCRALNYPARFVTGIDYGAAPELGPPDFHAYVEVFIGDRWFLFDPTGISPVTGLLRIGTGRDAADVSFATIFGPVRTGIPRVTISADNDPEGAFTMPMPTNLAVSTAA